MIRDLVNELHGGVSLLPQTIASATTVNGTAVDMSLSDGEVFAGIVTGAVTGADTVGTAKLQESATSGGTYTDIPGGTFTSIIVSSDSVYYRARGKRTLPHVRITITTAGASVSLPVAGWIEARKKISGSGTGYV